MTALLAGIADGAIVLAVALAAAAALRRSSAAMRHAILATGIIAALAMPALELLLPPLPVIDWHAPVTAVEIGRAHV